MDARTTASPHPTDTSEVAMQPQQEPDKISAYYSLIFPNFTYYLQTLSVTIGRRCIPNTTGSSSDVAQVDVDLGPLKSVSRLHAKIEYEEEEERFVLVVIGRNGAWVDGVWSGTGSRVSLTERSHIQIASRTFQFVLPPPPAPEDSPSPSSHSSENRPRSPSVDITSISPPSSMPSRSPPPPPVAPPRPTLQIPPLSTPPPLNSSKPNKPKANHKKRKKNNPEPIPAPKPEDMPPRPPFTYAQLCFRAIKAIGGKATLQEICHWITESFDWYKYNDAGWQSSVRHNLSSNRAFKKLERCGNGRGKGFFWSVDGMFEHMFEEQDRNQALKLQDGGAAKDGKSGKKKDRAGASLLEPPLKRSIRGDLSGAQLPPPLTSAPLKHSASTSTSQDPILSASANVKAEHAAPFESGLGPHDQIPESSTSTLHPAIFTGAPGESTAPPAIPALPSSLYIPIVVGPIPASHPSSSQPSDRTGPLTSTPIVLHDGTLILNPEVFSHLTQEQVRELEALGAQKALQILQGYIARFLKEQRLKKREAGRGRGRGRALVKRGRDKKSEEGNVANAEFNKGSTDAQASRTITGPFTTAPLPPRSSQTLSIQDGGNRPSEDVHPPSGNAFPVTIDAKPPVPVPVVADSKTTVGEEEEDGDPIIIVDDSDTLEAPAAKKRRLELDTAGSGTA